MRRLWLVLLLIVVGLLAACGGDDGDKKGNGATPTPAVSDLAVTKIELEPTQLAVGESYTVKVYVANLGGAASDRYDLEITLRDATRGTTSPVGELQGQSIGSGKEILAYETGQRQMIQAGSYQLQVRLIPAGSDSQPNNNSQSQAFTVN